MSAEEPRRPAAAAGAETATVPPAQAAPVEAREPPPTRAEAPILPPAARPTGVPAAAGASSPPAPPGYEVLRLLGRGGMGVVYLARHRGLNRVVALKMILAGGHAGQAELARFLAEAQAVAHLQHANIVQLFESDQHLGLPFFTLEYCPGGSLADKVREAPLPPAEAARVVEQLARGMAYARVRGVVHRDLKPENVLLGEDGTPKVTDFGLAKRVEAGSGLTQTGAILGTPSYMAPEQAAGQAKEVGPAADIYTLGAVLYRLLTGRPPFQAATPLDTVLQVVTKEPVPARQLQPGCPRDLETVCHKCLHKEPARRYASAADLAKDLRRFQAGEPIRARPVGRVERLAKWVRRRPALAALLAVSAAALLGMVALLDAARREADERSRTETGLLRETEEAQKRLAAEQAETRRQLKRTRRLLYHSQIVRAASLAEREPTRALTLLREPDACPSDLRDFAWGYYHRLVNRDRGTLTGHVGAIAALAVAPDGRTLATAGPDGKGGTQVLLWDVATARARSGFTRGGSDVAGLAFAPGRQLLAVAVNAPVAVTLWQVNDLARCRTLAAPPPAVAAVAFTADGALVAAAGQGVKVWDVASGKEHASLTGPPAQESPLVMPSATVLARFTADGRRVALAVPTIYRPKGAAPEKYPVRVFDVTAGKLLCEVTGGGKHLTGLALSPDGRWLALG
jgi:hypothetical protein